MTDDTTPVRARRRHRVRIQRYWLVIGLVLGGAVSVVALAALMAPERQHDIWVEMAKSSLQIMALALATGVVGAMLRDRDAAREEQRRHQASLLSFLDDIEATYSQVKSARRMLRTFGFDSPAVWTISAEQAQGFRTQMALLNEAELAFESHARKVAMLPGSWGDHAAPLVTELTRVYEYLRGVLSEWQRDPTVLQAGEETAAIAGWPNFRGFVGYDDEATRAFEGSVAQRMLTIGMLVRDAELPPPPPLLSSLRRRRS